MFTLIYNNGQFNSPDTLLPYLETNIGSDALIQIDCISPFLGTVEQLEQEVCYYLSNITPEIRVIHKITQNCSAEFTLNGEVVKYLAMWVHITKTKC